MAIRVESEMHRRRRSQNFGVAICLVLFIFLMMGLSFVKLTNSGPVEGYDPVSYTHLTLPTILLV